MFSSFETSFNVLFFNIYPLQFLCQSEKKKMSYIYYSIIKSFCRGVFGIMNYDLELRFAALTVDWNDGMLEKWNDGMAPFGQINACGGGRKDRWFCGHFLP
jgi:hypothetical protein